MRNTVYTVIMMILASIVMTGIASAAIVLADLDGVDDGQTKVVTIKYNGVIANPLRFINPFGMEYYDFILDNRLFTIIRNLGPENIRTYMVAKDTIGTSKARIIGIRGYSIYMSGLRSGNFSVGINSDEEVLINNELIRDSTLVDKVKIETIPTTIYEGWLPPS